MIKIDCKKLWIGYVVFVAITLAACSGKNPVSEDIAVSEKTDQDGPGLQLDKINLPEGFKIELYAQGITNARSMALSPNGTLFVGTREAGKIYAIQDNDGNFRADKIYVLDSGLRAPNGVAFREGDLFVAEVSKLWRYPNIENNLDNPSAPQMVYDNFPKDYHHGWKYISFGPDGKLYVPVGSPCNNCESRNEIYGSITRMDPDGSNREVYAQGVRNTVGFAWHPVTGEMWFTDNGRDMLGDDIPPCELNRITAAGQHFGYPYCHGGSIADLEFGDKYPCSDFVQPAQTLGAHVAPLGMKFYNGEMFPEQYRGHAFIAEHGSWNRSPKVGYRISMVKIEDSQAVAYKTFIDGWLDQSEQEAWGRPVDVLVMEDGSMLISDDKGGAIYRVTYEG